jgi:hypothetical protein
VDSESEQEGQQVEEAGLVQERQRERKDSYLKMQQLLEL